MNLSIGHLSTLIRRETGLSFSEYVTAKRMEDAKKLLCQENLSVEEVAEQVGYHDYFYFTKAFKKYAGVSPSVYRKGQ
ncbi:MAG: helix-turn-helix domain-containing protein [Lachnospiraceae bacterium]